MLDIGVSDFNAMTAHIHWVYCAYILLSHEKLPTAPTMLERQRCLQKMVEREPFIGTLKRIVAARTQFGGPSRQERLARAAIQDAIAS